MSPPKAAPLRLDPVSYESLRQQILRRDGWRCQACGAMSNLEVHHMEFRSHSGADSEENLITLCAECHERVHRRPTGYHTRHCADLILSAGGWPDAERVSEKLERQYPRNANGVSRNIVRVCLRSLLLGVEKYNTRASP